MVLYPHDPDEYPYDPFQNRSGGTTAPPPGGTTPPGGDSVTPLSGSLAPVSGGSGGGGGGGGRPTFNFGDVPDFIPPVFQRPTFEDAQNEPGYRFRLQSGSDALERSASARGVLRTGGTLRDITEYGQNFGAQEYGNVYNRALQAFDRDYRGAYDAYAPNLAEWTFLSNAELQAGLAQFNRRSGGGGGGLSMPPPDPPGKEGDMPGGPLEPDDWIKTGRRPVF